MEKRIKSKGSYTKSGKLFLNEFNRIKTNDSLENSEYYFDFYKNGKLTYTFNNSIVTGREFNENISNYIDSLRNNINLEWWDENYYKANNINHILKNTTALYPEYYLNTNLDFAKPSEYNEDSFLLEYNESYNKNFTANYISKNYFIKNNIKKLSNTSNLSGWWLPSNNNIDKPFNDQSQKFLDIKLGNFFNLENNSLLLNSTILQDKNIDLNLTSTKLLNNQKNKISAEEKYNIVNSNQKKELQIEIELDTPNDLFLQYTARSLEDDIIRSAYENVLDTDSKFTFRKLTSNNDQKKYINSIRNDIGTASRTFNRINTPFAIYNFNKKNWEYRGISYPLIHMTNSYINNSILSGKVSLIDNNSYVNRYLKKFTYANNSANITEFINFFKKYFVSQDPLTSTSTLISKIRPKNDSDLSLDSNNGKYQNYSYPILSLPTELFGFPNHHKFHGFTDNLIKMDKFIEKPFVLNRTNFSTNIEVIGEFTSEDQTYYEEAFNICLNYFIIKQTKIHKFNIETKWKPFVNKKIENTTFTYGSDSDFDLKSLEINYDDTNSTEYNQFVIRKLSNDLDHTDFSSNRLTNYNFYENDLNSNNKGKIEDLDSKKYIREIVNHGNVLFITPSILSISESSTPKYNTFSYKSSRLNSLLLKNNFDEIKILEYPNHSDLLQNNNLVSLLDYNGEININSIIKNPSQINQNINAHLLNLNFDLPINNCFDKFSGTRTLNDFNNGRQFKSKSYNVLTESYDNDKFILQNVSIPDNIENEYALYQYQDMTTNDISQYVLYPDDEISICVSISPLIHPLKAKQLLKIKKGKCRISLFGHYLNDSNKIYDENRLLKNYKSNNFPNIVVGDIVNTNEYSDFKELNYLNYLDKQYTKTLDFFNDRGLDENAPSCLVQGKTFNPYLRIGNDYNLNTKENFIYDDAFLQYTENDETVALGKKYFKDNVFNSILQFKKYKYSIPVSAEITQGGTEYISYPDDYAQNSENLNLKNFNMYFSSKRYGHIRDIFEQRKYTTLYNKSSLKKESIISKQYINPENGQIISDLTSVYGLNKSLTYELVDSKGVPVTPEVFNGDSDIEKLPYPFYDNVMRWNNTWSWSYNDFLNLKHVAFRENVSS